MKLVIVESPTKAKTISKFLGKDYMVESSFGHIRDLPKSKLGIDPEKNFEPHYIIPVKSKKMVTALKKLAAKSDTVILATDEDREGEAIAWHLVHALDFDNAKIYKKKPELERIVFHEITKTAIADAIKNPRKINEFLVDAQQGRRILDRLVGYKLSPFLWKKVAAGLSAGRVQSVALRLIVDRENEIKAFKPQEYWTIAARISENETAEEKIEAKLTKIDGKSIGKFDIPDDARAKEITTELKSSNCTVANIEQKEVKKNPLPPFITSTLQQTAASRLYFSAKKTMLLAQRLYENGLITYMRTDSVNLSNESTTKAKQWLNDELGAEYATDAPRAFKSRSKLAQEAHEAIRPTDVYKTPDSVTIKDEGQKKVYTLIWQRFVASQMPQARLQAMSVEFNAQPKDESLKPYTLKATGQKIAFDGYLRIWPQKLEEYTLPELTKDAHVIIREVTPDQHFTEPPPRYSEATLIKTLEEYDIGRPSTYAPTLSVIQTRNYVEKEAGKFKPTDIGTLVNGVLTEHFPDIVDIGFTAQMESELDDIAEGQTEWQDVISKFYVPFEKHLEKKYEEVSKEKLVEPEKTEEVCDLCGKPMVVKMSRFGKFLGCSGFPDCRGIKKLAGGGGGKKEEPKTIGMKCPTCTEGDVIERRVVRGRARGKVFWGCSRYPKCDYASWEDPREPSKKDKKEEKKSEKAT